MTEKKTKIKMMKIIKGKREINHFGNERERKQALPGYVMGKVKRDITHRTGEGP